MAVFQPLLLSLLPPTVYVALSGLTDTQPSLAKHKELTDKAHSNNIFFILFPFFLFIGVCCSCYLKIIYCTPGIFKFTGSFSYSQIIILDLQSLLALFVGVSSKLQYATEPIAVTAINVNINSFIFSLLCYSVSTLFTLIMIFTNSDSMANVL